MKRLLTLLFCCSIILTAQAQLIRMNTERYTPGTITFNDGHQVTYRWVQLPHSGLTEILVANDEKHKKKEKIQATEIESITFWTEKNPDSLLTLYYVHADKTKIPLAGVGLIGLSLIDSWGEPIVSSAWGTVYRCPAFYSIDKKTGLFKEEYLTHQSNMGNGMMMVSTIPATCFLKCQKYENAQLIGTSIPLTKILVFTAFTKKISPFFADNKAIANAIENKYLNGNDIQYILDEMEAFYGLATSEQDNSSLAEGDVVLYPEYSEDEAATMFDYSTWYNRLDLKKESRCLSDYARSGYKGIAVLAQNNGSYALADRQVVGYAKTATVVWMVNGEMKRFEHCKVLGADTAKNISFIALPDEANSLPIPVDSQLIVNKKNLKKDYFDLIRCADIDGKSWLKLMAQLPEKKIRQIVQRNNAMPLDIVLETMKSGKSQLTKGKNGKTHVKSRLGLVSDVRRFGVGMYYDNFFSRTNMQQGLELDFGLGRRRIGLFGVQIGCLLEEGYQVKLLPGSVSPKETLAAMQFGLYGGAQVPLRVADRHLLLPRTTIGVNFGPFFDGADHKPESFMLATDTRVGLDYRYEMDKLDLYIGVRYNFHFYATQAKMAVPTVNNTGLSMLPYIEHGISAHFGVYIL